MISKHVIASGGAEGAARYHDRAFSADGASRPRDGRDNYYAGEKANAVWQGEGARLLGLLGEPVRREDFVAFLEGRMPHPVTGEVQDLADNARGASRRAGLDLTIAPPKSVSIVALVGGDERVMQAHREANASAMGWIEQHASVVRVRRGAEVTSQLKGNLLWATVVHETNRSNEPQLHSHNVVVSAVFDAAANKWRSLTNDELYLVRTGADTVYKAELARRLAQLGYRLDHTRNNVDFEIAGIAPEHLDLFSGRRAQIREALIARGIDPDAASYQARQTAALDSRARKAELPREVLGDVWQATARNTGLEVAPRVEAARQRALERGPQQGPQQEPERAVVQGAERAPGGSSERLPEQLTEQSPEHVHAAPAPRASPAALRALSWAVQHLAERQQAFRQSELEVVGLQFEPGLGLADVQQAIAEHAQGQRLVSGTIEGHAGAAWTTQEAVRAEAQLAAVIAQGKGEGNVVLETMADFNLAADAFERRMSERTAGTWRLSDEQRSAAHNALLHPDSIQGIQGEAGTGKTAALAFVREVAASRGWLVLGMATSSSAAQELQAASGIPSQTVAGFFAQRDRALAELTREADELRRALAEANASAIAAGAEVPRSFEQVRLQVRSRDIDFGSRRYAFDHQRAQVYRSANAFSNFLGGVFADFAERGRAALDRLEVGGAVAAVGIAGGDRTPPATLGGRLQRDLLERGTRASDALARTLSAYERVGDVEANAARNALYLKRQGAGASGAAARIEARIGELQRGLDLKEAALANLRRTGNAQGSPTLLVMDESSLTGTRDTTRVAEFARSIGARVIFQGDVQQHGSVAAGRAFWQAQRAGMTTASLTETRRFDSATAGVKTALARFKDHDLPGALQALDRMEVEEGELAQRTASVYLAQREALVAPRTGPGTRDAARVGIVTMTNADRKAINAAVHHALREAGAIQPDEFSKLHLDDPKLTAAQRTNVGMMAAAGVDRLILRGAETALGLQRGDVLRVGSFDIEANRVNVIAPDGRRLVFNPQQTSSFEPLKAETRTYSVGDQVTARAVLRVPAVGQEAAETGVTAAAGRVFRVIAQAETERQIERIANGSVGRVAAIDDGGAVVHWADGRSTRLDNAALARVDHAYARTSFKEQGATNDVELVAVSTRGARAFNAEAHYVSITRARENTIILTSDFDTMLRRAGAQVERTVAVKGVHLQRVQGAVEGLKAGAAASLTSQRQRGSEQIVADTLALGRRATQPAAESVWHSQDGVTPSLSGLNPRHGVAAHVDQPLENDPTKPSRFERLLAEPDHPRPPALRPDFFNDALAQGARAGKPRLPMLDATSAKLHEAAPSASESSFAAAPVPGHPPASAQEKVPDAAQDRPLQQTPGLAPSKGKDRSLDQGLGL